MRESVYLDYNATTPVAPEVAKAVTRCLSEVLRGQAAQLAQP